MDHPIPLQELPEALHRFCDPNGPVPARMMAAKGLVPLGPADLLTVLYQLSHDPDRQVAASAGDKAAALPDNIVAGALSAALDSRVLDFYASKLQRNEKALEVILLNRTTADETVARLAKSAGEATCEMIATNEQRLLRCPDIISNLYHNRSARMSTVNRAVELAVRNNVTVDGIAAFKEVAAAIQGELVVEDLGPTPADLAFNQTISLGEALVLETGDDPEALEADDESATRRSLQWEWGRKSNTEKIRLATIGTQAHRTLAIRDANKLVAIAAIKSPSLRGQEVEVYTRNRALPEEVIRHIASNREFTKSYAVKLALVQNPKTPLPKAMSFLTHLRPNDLKAVSTSKNVPQAVAQAARQQLSKRK